MCVGSLWWSMNISRRSVERSAASAAADARDAEVVSESRKNNSASCRLIARMIQSITSLSRVSRLPMWLLTPATKGMADRFSSTVRATSSRDMSSVMPPGPSLLSWLDCMGKCSMTSFSRS